MNNKKGITIVSTLITLVVISILAGTVTISTNYIMNDTYKKEFIREYKLVQSATDDYIMRNSGNIDFEETTLDVSMLELEELQQFSEETIVDNKIDMYIVDLEKIGVTSLTYGIKAEDDETDVYLLSKETNIVYYQKGFENNDTIYYRAIND